MASEGASLADIVRYKAWHAGERRQTLAGYADASDRFEPLWKRNARELHERSESKPTTPEPISVSLAGWALVSVMMVVLGVISRAVIPRSTMSINGETMVVPPHGGLFWPVLAMILAVAFGVFVGPALWIRFRRWRS